MARVSICPECGRDVTLPEEVDQHALVGCPLCDGQFLLCEVDFQTEPAPPLLVPMAGSKLSKVEFQRIATIEAAEQITRDAAILDDRAKAFLQKIQDLSPENPFDVDSLLEDVDVLEADAKSIQLKTADCPLETEIPDVVEEVVEEVVEDAHKAKTKAINGVLGSMRALSEKFDSRTAFLTSKADNTEGMGDAGGLGDLGESSGATNDTSQENDTSQDVGPEDEQLEETESGDPDDGFASWIRQNEGDSPPESSSFESESFSLDVEPKESAETDLTAKQSKGLPEETTEVKALRSEAADLRSKAADLRVRADALAVEPVDVSPGQFDAIGSAVSQTHADGAFDFSALDRPEPTTTGTIARPQRRAKKKKSMFHELLSIVLGGIGGVLIVLYGLAIFGGDKYMMPIYLPGVKCTDEHRPEWWPTWAALGSDDTQQDLDQDE